MNPQKKPFINLVSSLLRYSPEAALAIADRLEAEDRAGKLPVNWNSDYVKTRFSEHDSIQSLADEFENFFDFEDYPGRSDPKALIKATCVDPIFLDNGHVVVEHSTKNWEHKNSCSMSKDRLHKRRILLNDEMIRLKQKLERERRELSEGQI